MTAIKLILLVVLFTICTSSIVPDSQNLRSDYAAFSTPSFISVAQAVQFKPIAIKSSVIRVEIADILDGIHGVAYYQILMLYPQYAGVSVQACNYYTYGTVRIYTFIFKISATISESATTSVEDRSSDIILISSNTDFEEVNIIRAYSTPRISRAVNFVTKDKWHTIGTRPLNRIFQRSSEGKYIYRFNFENILTTYEFNENASPAKCDEIDGSKDSKTTSASTDDSEEPSGYFADNKPMFSISNGPEYSSADLSSFKKHPGYKQIVQALTTNLGVFDENWIIGYAVSSEPATKIDSIKIEVNFSPFLLKQNYEAYYYGSVAKASLLKVDEKVFNNDGKGFLDWNEIKNFNSFNAFHEANEYMLYQFTWLRFYTVVSAYSALYKTGRNVRLVYQGNQGYVDAGNQINVIIYIDCNGKYYMDRNDFHATNTGSYGRNDWVSLFVPTPDVTKAQYYQRIVNFFQSIYPKYWSTNQLTDIKVKDDLHVIQFKNPTNDQSQNCVLSIANSNLQLLNNFQWSPLSESSPLRDRLVNFVNGRYQVNKIMFINFLLDNDGQHFEVSFLNKAGKYSASYLRYLTSDDVFTEDTQYDFKGMSYGTDFSEVPLPKDVHASIKVQITTTIADLTAIIKISNLTATSFEIHVVIKQSNWKIVVTWVKGAWVNKEKSKINDEYSVSLGYPSALSAACTGFIAKVHRAEYNSQYKYVLIETRNVGLFLYSRLTYKFGSKSFRAVVKSTYSVQNSYVLDSWEPLYYVVDSDDYGYGSHYNYNYGLDNSRYLYNIDNDSQQKITVAVVSQSKDIYCSIWSKNSCLKCASDCFLGDDGVCVKVDAKCSLWHKDGSCLQCAYGYQVSPLTGNCFIFFGSLSYPY